MRLTIITGGQTGVDQAAWDAAIEFDEGIGNIRTCGYMPRRFMTEDGPMPHFRTKYGAIENDSPSYKERTIKNVMNSDAFVLIGNPDSSGGKLLRSLVGKKIGGPPLIIVVNPNKSFGLDEANKVLSFGKIEKLMIAGNRGSSNPMIYSQARRFVLRLLENMEDIWIE
jgi:hypothetical protein